MQPTLSRPFEKTQPKDSTLDVLTKSIEQSLRVEGYVISPEIIKRRLIAHLEKK
jgi:hypothetical protein